MEQPPLLEDGIPTENNLEKYSVHPSRLPEICRKAQKSIGTDGTTRVPLQR